MIEIPESQTLSRQIAQALSGKTIRNAYADSSPHKFAWYFEDPLKYHALLSGKTIDGSYAYGGMVGISAGDARMLFTDGVSLRYFAAGEAAPKKHQLLLEFEDDSFLACSVQMYGGLWAYPEGRLDNGYYLSAKSKPSPLSEAFDFGYFRSLVPEKTAKMSVKAFLATEQRIPGLGNGVLQDILFAARMHPRLSMENVSEEDLRALYAAVKSTLIQMTAQGGRDTEQDLFGVPGGYRTVLSRNTVGGPCPECGGLIKKEAYLGGSVYFCAACQRK